MSTAAEVRVRSLRVRAYQVPTESQPESDGTAEWTSTTLVLVELTAGDATGLGYTYADKATARFIDEVLRPYVDGADPFTIPAVATRLMHQVRNHGRSGVAAMAVSAVDAALWDLKSRLLGIPLFRLLGAARDGAEVYASGGFTSYSERELVERLAGCAEQGFRRVKMKVGRDPKADARRVRAAREAVGPEVELFVDANGAYDRKQALRMAESFAAQNVRWLEEPVSSDDLEGLRLVRDRAPPTMEVAAGEYGYHPVDFRRMLEAGAVDVMMADATRCLGVSGFLAAASLCDAFAVPLSAHCAPALHLHPCLSLQRFRHLELFHDHVRIEAMLFDGAPRVRDGRLRADPSRPGSGLELKREDALKFEV
ncbi:MAG TPA: enolase C-terminal domain-like protein [Myxococcaceae bacterium]|nr:enolase C-terminal domain-like protein [Myxococcaceae bacterium]